MRVTVNVTSAIDSCAIWRLAITAESRGMTSSSRTMSAYPCQRPVLSRTRPSKSVMRTWIDRRRRQQRRRLRQLPRRVRSKPLPHRLSAGSSHAPQSAGVRTTQGCGVLRLCRATRAERPARIAGIRGCRSRGMELTGRCWRMKTSGIRGVSRTLKIRSSDRRFTTVAGRLRHSARGYRTPAGYAAICTHQ